LVWWLQFEGDDIAAKDVAMHVAAMKPVALSSADRACRPGREGAFSAAAKAAEDAAVAAGKPVQSTRSSPKRSKVGCAEVPQRSLAVQPGFRQERQADR
jgi:elongation factor Ts